MKYLRKTIELGFSTTLLSTLLLTACGGGGGGAVGGGTAGTSVTLTPVKGKFQGSCTVSVTNTAGVVLVPSVVQAINANGTTTVTLPANATGPYLVSISGAAGNTCQYFNDNQANPQLLTLSPNQSLNALVSSTEITSASGVAVTAITEMAYQAASAVNLGTLVGLTDTSPAIAQGRAAAVSLAGLTGASAVTSIFTPPAVIPASGTAPTDNMGNALVNIANLNGAAPMNAINLISLYAASAVGMPPSASAVAALPPNFVGQGAMFAAQMVANAGAATFNAANAATTASFLNDLATSGVRQINFGILSSSVSIPAEGTVITTTLANAVYIVNRALSNLTGGKWTSSNANYLTLTTRGWMPENQLATSAVQNPDGSFKIYQEGYGTSDQIVSQQNLLGTPYVSAIPTLGMGVDTNGQFATNASGVPSVANVIPVGTFSTGAISYMLMPAAASAVATQDIYNVQATPFNRVTAATTGLPLTALPVAGSSFCTYNNTRYMQPSVTVAGAYDMFNLTTFGACVLPVGAIPFQTITPVTVNGMMEFSVPATAMSPAFTDVIAQVSGIQGVTNGVYLAWKTPKGGTVIPANVSRMQFNAAAATQLLNAVKLPQF
jgi:hypothetical protein